MPPKLSGVRIYSKEEAEDSWELLTRTTKHALGDPPFEWQLDLSIAVLQGLDVILDAGTGCGKTKCFTMPLLLHEKDMSIIVSPLTALMMDQAGSARLSTVALCQDLWTRKSKEDVFAEIVAGTYRQIIVSPEIATSTEFRDEVLSKHRFYRHLRLVSVDEAHCISLWGGTFRTDYSQLGILRGRIPTNVPFILASATLPSHVLDDVRTKLQISQDAQIISLTNDRPNVTLSVRSMRHSEASKADLRFLIPMDTKEAADIPVTLVYCNTRLECEDISEQIEGWLVDAGLPRNWVAFYHAKIGPPRKHELEMKLSEGSVRILACTDALGMGCDMRNVPRTILWKLPPSFCALAQRAGRAARDLSTRGDAIIIVPPKAVKDPPAPTDTSVAISQLVETIMDAAETDEHHSSLKAQLHAAGIIVGEGDEVVEVVSGTRIEHASHDDPELDCGGTIRVIKRKKKTTVQCSATELRHLTSFVRASTCRREVWNTFFGNKQKAPLLPGSTCFRPLPDMLCCDNCHPDHVHFQVETAVVLEKSRGLKRGKKRPAPPDLEAKIREHLQNLRTRLFRQKYPSATAIFSEELVMSDDIVDKLATCGERITEAELARYTLWPHAFEKDRKTVSVIGKELCKALGEAYQAYTEEKKVQDQETQQKLTIRIPPSSFYAKLPRKD